MNKKIELQDVFLDLMKKNQLNVSVFLKSGIQLKGKVENFDQFTVLLKNNSIIQMVYKHAISSIVPLAGSGAGLLPEDAQIYKKASSNS